MEIDALAALAANTIVATAVTDAFEGLRAKVARVFGRDKPDPGVQRRLDATRQELTAAVPGALESAKGTQARQWETRFADLLADHPEAAAELQALLAEFKALSPDTDGSITNTISGTVLNGPVLMGRDFGDITIGGPEISPGPANADPSPRRACLRAGPVPNPQRHQAKGDARCPWGNAANLRGRARFPGNGVPTGVRLLSFLEP
jgi:hypothetical protein